MTTTARTTQAQTVDPTLTAHEFALIAGDFANTGLGAHRTFQTVSTIGKWIDQIGRWTSSVLSPTSQSVLEAVKIGDQVGMIPKLVSQTGIVIKSLDSYRFEAGRATPDEITAWARLKKVVFDAIEWIGDSAKVIMLAVPQVFGLDLVSRTSDLTLDVRDFHEAVEGVRTSRTHLERPDISETERRRPTEEGRMHMLKIAKAIFSFIGGILGFVGLFLGYAVLPSVILLTISTATLFFALWNQFYKDSMTHNLQARLAQRQLQHLQA